MADVKPKPAKIERLENDYTRRLDRQQATVHHHQWLGKRRMRRATRILAIFAVFAVVLGIQLVRTNAFHHVRQVTTSKQKLATTKATDHKLQYKSNN